LTSNFLAKAKYITSSQSVSKSIQENIMPSTINTYVAQNYRKQQVPFSRFQTRKVAWYKIGWADTNAGGYLDMTNMNTMIDAIQTRAEIVMVGAPHISNSWGKFMVAVFEDTANIGSDLEPTNNQGNPGNYNNMSTSIEEALREATGDGNLLVQRFYLAGAPETDHLGYDGFSTENQYQEYDTKAQFEDNSYTQP
jgi:hypothetical protein